MGDAASAATGDPFDLTGKVALVTGAGRGIGRSIAESLARRGADVVAVDVLDPTETVAWLRTAYPCSTFEGRTVDVRDRAQVEQVVRATAEQFGHLDVVVNNAGTASRTGLPDFTDEEWSRDLDTNLRGTFLVCQAAIHPWMERQRSGTIINISSISGIMGGPMSGGQGGGRSGPAYAASKGGIIALTKWLAKEVGSWGITVNSVAPGPVATPMTGTVDYDFDQQISGFAARTSRAVGGLARGCLAGFRAISWSSTADWRIAPMRTWTFRTVLRLSGSPL